MSARKFKFRVNLFLLIALMLFSIEGGATSRAEQSKWRRFLPDFATTQYAGNIAQISVGVGWEYANNKWATEVLLGRVPNGYTRHDKYTLTIRQTYTPWQLELPFLKANQGKVKFYPLACGLYANSVLGNKNFWMIEPRRVYGGNYYRFSTRVRFALTLGERIAYEFPQSMKRFGESCEFYYEFSLNELSLINAVDNRHLSLTDVFSLGIGARWHW